MMGDLVTFPIRETPPVFAVDVESPSDVDDMGTAAAVDIDDDGCVGCE